jgi:ferredoxin-type protein NapH
MSGFLNSLAVMLGREPTKPAPEAITPAAQALMAFKRTKEQVALRKQAIKEEKAHFKPSRKWRLRRWASIIFVNLLFVLSYQADIQVVEGALTASRFAGFHMADLNAALQVMLAYKHVVINLAIGATTILIGWWLLGGRSFCSWVCPYHLLGEVAEALHLKLAAKGLVSDHPLHRATRTVMYGIFALLAVVTGYTVFETINPVGILSRAFTYGAGLALAWVGLLLLIEVFYSRRFWCRYMCPVGLTYGLVGAAASPVRVTYEADKCLHEGECRKVCMVPHVLSITRMGWNQDVKHDIGADCTRCGMCVEVCPTKALTFKVKGLESLG